MESFLKKVVVCLVQETENTIVTTLFRDIY